MILTLNYFILSKKSGKRTDVMLKCAFLIGKYVGYGWRYGIFWEGLLGLVPSLGEIDNKRNNKENYVFLGKDVLGG